MARFEPDLIVLDWMLPDIDGHRGRPAPARAGLQDRDPLPDREGRGREQGRGAPRRRRRLRHEAVQPRRGRRARAGDPAADRRRPSRRRAPLRRPRRSTRAATRSSAATPQLELTATEFALLRFFLLNPRRVLSKGQILQNVWRYDFGGNSNVVETYVSYLRRKLDATGPPLIKTVRQAGYMLEESLGDGQAPVAARAAPARGRRARGGRARRRDVATYTSLQLVPARPHRHARSTPTRRRRCGRPRGWPGRRRSGVGGRRRRSSRCARSTATVSSRTFSGRDAPLAARAFPAPSCPRRRRRRRPPSAHDRGRAVLHRRRRATAAPAVPRPGVDRAGLDERCSWSRRRSGTSTHAPPAAPDRAPRHGSSCSRRSSALGLWLVRLGLRPLDAIGETAAAIAAGDLSRRVERAEERTEVGRLGLALNAMLGRIEAAFRAQRRPSASCGASSPTPRTSCARRSPRCARTRSSSTRGAAERPDDLERSMKGISRESERMSVLVDDLLLLARLDEGRPLEREPVELDEVVGEAVETAQARRPRSRRSSSTPSRATVLGDRDRLRQIVDNLLANVRAHTPAGTPAAVSVARRNGSAVIAVADAGPGLDEEQLEQRLRALLPRRPVPRPRERRRRARPRDRRRRRRGARRDRLGIVAAG